MAGSFSDYLEKKLLDAVCGGPTFALPATVYVALFTDSNTATQRDAGTVTEVSGNAYARVAVTNNATNFPAASGIVATKQNGVAITFPTATPAGWGTANAFGIYDAAAAGNLLLWGDLTSPQVVNIGAAPVFAINALTVTLD